MKQRIFAVLNQKGGVGKTTTSYNLAFAFADRGKNVLAVDLDPQSHFAVSLGLKDIGVSGVDDIFLEGAQIQDLIRKQREHLDILPAGYRLTEVEKLSAQGKSQAVIVRDAINSLNQQYDYIIIDCPPTSGLLNFNALYASDEVIIPVSSDYLALQGLAQMLRTLRSAKSYMGKPTKTWIALTRFTSRRRLSQEVRDKLLQHFPNQVLATPIRECAPVAESPGFGKSVIEYKPSSNGAQDYLSLADDIIKNRTMKPIQ